MLGIFLHPSRIYSMFSPSELGNCSQIIKLRVGRPRKRCTIPEKDNGLVTSSKCADRPKGHFSGA